MNFLNHHLSEPWRYENIVVIVGILLSNNSSCWSPYREKWEEERTRKLYETSTIWEDFIWEATVLILIDMYVLKAFSQRLPCRTLQRYKVVKVGGDGPTCYSWWNRVPSDGGACHTVRGIGTVGAWPFPPTLVGSVYYVLSILLGTNAVGWRSGSLPAPPTLFFPKEESLSTVMALFWTAASFLQQVGPGWASDKQQTIQRWLSTWNLGFWLKKPRLCGDQLPHGKSWAWRLTVTAEAERGRGGVNGWPSQVLKMLLVWGGRNGALNTEG